MEQYFDSLKGFIFDKATIEEKETTDGMSVTTESVVILHFYLANKRMKMKIYEDRGIVIEEE